MSDHHEYEEVHLHDEHDAEDIELVGSSNGGRRRQRRSAPPPTSSSSGGGGGSSSSSTTMWLIILFLIGLVGVYKLGMEEGKAEVQHETHSNVGKAGENNHQSQSAVDETSTAATIATTTTTTTTTTSTKSPMKFTMSQLTAMRTECHKLIDLLDNYYFGKHQAIQMLMAPYIDPWNFDHLEEKGDTEKQPSPTNLRANKLVDTMLRALVTDSQTSFLMGGIGSSVMAGHDNCHYDSYESQMERTFGPVWKAANMEFTFQNAGEGGGCGDSYENQIYCVRQNVSPNIDILHYEWTYFEHGGAYAEHESLLRWVQMLPKQPPLHIFNTGTNEKNGQDVKLVQYYAQFGFNAFYMKSGLYNGGYDYDTERKEQDIDRFSWGYIGDGYHNTTRYGEMEVDDARRDSLGTVVSLKMSKRSHVMDILVLGWLRLCWRSVFVLCC
jgi:hypothetical protein